MTGTPTPRKPAGLYLSVVVAARNDDYGGNFLHRLQNSLDVLLTLSERHALDAELLIVEWNPPEGRPRLSEALRWPACRMPGGVRIVEVPAEIHQRIPGAEKMPMFESFAKNTGIRRARGDFVLVTNADILFSAEMVAYLARRPLSDGRFYRVDRFDFQGHVPPGLRVDAVLAFARRRVHTVHIRQIASIDTLDRIRLGWLQRCVGAISGAWPGSHDARLRLRPSRDSAVSLDDKGLWWGLHTNAAGDFLLAPREAWHAIAGFPEYSDTYIHLDGYACYQLKAAGLEQRLLTPPRMIFHADHSRAEQKKRPASSRAKWQADLEAIRNGHLGPCINGQVWGLPDADLVDTVVQPAVSTTISLRDTLTGRQAH